MGRTVPVEIEVSMWIAMCAQGRSEEQPVTAQQAVCAGFSIGDCISFL